VKLDMGPLGDAYVFSAHLTAYPYEPYRLNPQAAQLGGGTAINTGTPAGDAAAAVASANSTRGAKRTQILNEIAAVVPGGAKVFLLGDYNEPSHLDWTEAAGPNGAGRHTHVVPWPASTAVANAGLVDSYRQVHPDETTSPGYTWTTLVNNPEVHDRIDFVYYNGAGLSATNSQVVGSFSTAGGVVADIRLNYYPSDHRAVLTTFDVVLPGDYNDNGVVDAADYTVWRDNLDITAMLPNDMIGGTIGAAQYDQWKAHFGAAAGSGGSAAGLAAGVPEPATCWLACPWLVRFLTARRRIKRLNRATFLESATRTDNR
jgi:Endonuclease/Exonuclease/phosphatase family